MLHAASPFFAQACAAVAQSATGAMESGAQSFAAVLEALRPAEKKTSAAAAPAAKDLGQQLESRLQTLQNLLKRYLSASDTEIHSPLTLQVDHAGNLEVYGDATDSDELKRLFAQHADLRTALHELANAHAKQVAATNVESNHTGGLSAAESSLRLFVRGDSVELL